MARTRTFFNTSGANKTINLLGGLVVPDSGNLAVASIFTDAELAAAMQNGLGAEMAANFYLQIDNGAGTFNIDSATKAAYLYNAGTPVSKELAETIAGLWNFTTVPTISSVNVATEGYVDSAVAGIAGQWGPPVADVAAMKALRTIGIDPPVIDKQIRLAETNGTVYRFDNESVLAEDTDKVFAPTDRTGPLVAGRWIMVQSMIQNHQDLSGLNAAGSDMQHLTDAEKGNFDTLVGGGDVTTLHNHDGAYFTEGEFVDTGGSAGAPVKLNGSGLIDPSMLGSGGTPALIAFGRASNVPLNAYLRGPDSIFGSVSTYRMIRAGRITGVSAELSAALGGGVGRKLVFQVHKNGLNLHVDSNLEVVQAATGNVNDCSASVNTAFAAGDKISVYVVSSGGDPTDMKDAVVLVEVEYD